MDGRDLDLQHILGAFFSAQNGAAENTLLLSNLG